MIRRSQLIAPFGVGAMTVLANGTSVISAGLDYWFERPEHSELHEAEFELKEWRLERRLRVGGFRVPPDYRTPRSVSDSVRVNIGLTVPFLRFPTWSVCSQSKCRHMKQHGLSFRDRPTCENPEHGNLKYPPMMVQVAFVAICEQGHIMDFPWREWVHRSITPNCRGQLKLISTGAGTLDGQRVECECGVPARTLRDVTIAGRLSSSLERGVEFECPGAMPWHGGLTTTACGAPLRASLRGASNVYFAHIASSIDLPLHIPEVQEAVDILSEASLNVKVSGLAQLGLATSERVRKLSAPLCANISDEHLQQALEVLFPTDAGHSTLVDVTEQEFRRDEYRLLREPSTHDSLRITQVDFGKYGDDLTEWLDRISLVERLRETRALWGFSRVHPTPPRIEVGKAMLRIAALNHDQQWLPAYVVHGEGIYLEISNARLTEWEKRPSVVQRVERLELLSQGGDHIALPHVAPLSARMVLIHTLAHVLINQLVFECGYSSASLRERIFVSETPNAMAGLLIYTASGDSEGTMGGLVSMGQPGRLEAVLRAARDNAGWCAADPVCMEIGGSGQGPESCNLAACHSCALLPETACEEFNRFLDRAMLVGTLDDPTIGFFN
ncbi:DrmB family protein [Nocardia sp. NPDC050412]|uniref:DrmB family protein n=1 Tax=Nocardia sp. NPDC050412 TaxID=3364320 RepID=UPI0037AC1AEB